MPDDTEPPTFVNANVPLSEAIESLEREREKVRLAVALVERLEAEVIVDELLRRGLPEK